MPAQNELIQELFRKEFAKMVAVISRLAGLRYIDVAEDIVAETFLQASETWSRQSVPSNPAAWLYAVARQKTFYHFRRNKILTGKIIPSLQHAEAGFYEMEEPDFSAPNIKDSQLQMMFAICNPVIASEAQIGLALRVLCGFGIEEIAEAFFSNKETINKRLSRAKEKLRVAQIRLEFPALHETGNRLDNVLHIIYLLFNEGYYSSTQNRALRKDFCLEAIRLGLLLTGNAATDLPKTRALMALMCFHASRFDARRNNDLVLYDQQDESLWNKELIGQGNYFLNAAAQGHEMSAYHLEAGIAFWHCKKEDSQEKWACILFYYDLLLEINYSPGAALNRVYALSKAKGKEVALQECEKIQLPENHFYFTLLGELHEGTDNGMAAMFYQRAVMMAKTISDKQVLEEKIKKLKL